mgnify:CR=1 FL=1
MTTQNEKTDYLSEWPAHYYEIEDINERERILKLAIEQKLDPAGDEKRLLVLKKRFGEKPDRNLFREFTDRGWIEETGRIVRLTEEGMAYSDYIGQAFISPAVRKLMSEYVYP